MYDSLLVLYVKLFRFQAMEQLKRLAGQEHVAFNNSV